MTAYMSEAGLEKPSSYTLTTPETWAETLRLISVLRNSLVHGARTVNKELGDLCALPHGASFKLKEGDPLKLNIYHLQLVDLFAHDLMTAFNLSMVEKGQKEIKATKNCSRQSWLLVDVPREIAFVKESIIRFLIILLFSAKFPYMNTSFWVGVAFAIVLVGFLMVTFFGKREPSHSQYNTLRFLTALCGGCAAGFISGSALFNLNTKFGNGGTVAVSGTAGAALFFVIWFFYPKREAPKPPDSFKFSISAGRTFQGIAKEIAEISGAFVQFKNFKEDHLNAVLPAREVLARNAEDALYKLRLLNSSIPDYSVSISDNVYILEYK